MTTDPHNKARLADTWETYTNAWKVAEPEAKRQCFAQSLATHCRYNDPLMKTEGWDELEAYMLQFHQQIPGGHFVTKAFQAHSQKSIAHWDMCDAAGNKIGEGVSYGEYDDNAKLTSMTGFFETAEA